MIHVIDDWVIDSDGKQYVCGRLAKSKDKSGEMKDCIRDPFYYSTVSGCLQALSRRLRLEAIKNTDGGLDALLGAVRGCDTRLIDALSVFQEVEVVQRSKAK